MNEQATFLIIINFIPPYDAEIAALLAGPAGARTRFRYQTKYAPTITRVSSLRNREGTLLLRDRVTGWFMPLREAKVLSARQVGDVIYLETELAATAALSGDPSTRDSQLETFNKQVLAAIGTFANEPNTDLRNPILYEGGDIQRLLRAWADAASGDDVTHWGNIVKTIDDHYPGLDLDFFRVVQLIDSHAAAIRFAKSVNRDYGYTVTPGREYTLEVLQRTFTGRRGDSSVQYSRHMELLVLNDDIQVAAPQRPVLGKYDLLTFPIYVKPMTRPGIRSTSLNMVRPSLEQRYGLELPLLIRRGAAGHSLRLVALVIFTVALIAYADPGLAASILHIGPHHIVNVSEQTLEKISVVLMLISSNVTGIGSWISRQTDLEG
jgi:hypothetical protein